MLVTLGLGPSWPPCVDPKVPLDILAPMQAARNTANDILSQVGEACLFSSWRAALGKEHKLVCSLDASFASAVAFLEKATTMRYKDELHNHEVDIMPDATSIATVKKAPIEGVLHRPSSCRVRGAAEREWWGRGSWRSPEGGFRV